MTVRGPPAVLRALRGKDPLHPFPEDTHGGEKAARFSSSLRPNRVSVSLKYQEDDTLGARAVIATVATPGNCSSGHRGRHAPLPHGPSEAPESPRCGSCRCAPRSPWVANHAEAALPKIIVLRDDSQPVSPRVFPHGRVVGAGQPEIAYVEPACKQFCEETRQVGTEILVKKQQWHEPGLRRGIGH